MDQRLYINHVQPIQHIQKKPVEKTHAADNSTITFKEIFSQYQKNLPLRFSKHAEQRLASRNISLDEKGMKRLSEAIDQVAKKGAKESLVLMDDVAFVVSVKNRMVITAVDNANMDDNVFTNIDSAVIVKK